MAAVTTTLRLHRSRTGIPALWEQGGGFTNTGRAVIIASPQGAPKRPLYIRTRGTLACAEHALIPVTPGDFVVQAHHHRRDFTIRVYRVVEIGDEEATLTLVAEFDQGEWHPPLPPELEEAVAAARRKAACYHCREPHFVSE